ncbi:MAG: GNAT family N-acetyltransferase [Clostridia bacterium]|nr:GNAT family N-acetyltransferase [Clostridia bacterium]
MMIKEYSQFKEAEIRRLYSSVGWTAYTEDMDALCRGFINSLLTLAAYEDDELIGILRAVGDGETIVFIQDILVLPEKQRTGVGSSLVRALLERFPRVRQIELMTDNTPSTVAFYRALGFKELGEIGCCGFWKV